jgi:hypothetical protein
MIKFIKSFFGKKEEVTAEVPYKVEAPVVSTVSNQAVEAVVESMAPAKKPAAKKTTAKKAPPAKKPRAPKAAK